MEVPAKEPAACQFFRAGDVVLSCEPWVWAFKYHNYKTFCAYCLEETDSLLQCSTCKLHRYCGKECQTAHWKMEHKRECTMLKELNANIQQLDRRVEASYGGEFFFCTAEILMAKIVNKIKNGGEEQFTGISGEPRALDVLKMLPYDPRYEKRFKESDHSLHRRIWPKSSLGNIPADFDQLARKVYFNVFPVRDQAEKAVSIGAGLFLSALHRQMTPVCWDINVTMDLQKRTLVIRATENIADYTGLKDLRQNDHSANIFPMTRHERRLRVECMHFDPCTCWKCTEEYDAEINPLKCISSGCTERIPSDDRALEPCAQCGAINDQRLGQLKHLIRKNFATEHAVKDPDQRAKLQYALLLELDQADIVHADAHFRYACGHNALRFLKNEKRYEEMWNMYGGLVGCIRAVYPTYHLGRAGFLRSVGQTLYPWFSQVGREGLQSQWTEILGSGIVDWLWEARAIYRKLSGAGSLWECQCTQLLQAIGQITADADKARFTMAVQTARADKGSVVSLSRPS